VSENFLLGLQRSRAFSHAGFLDSRKLAEAANRAVRDYDVAPADLDIARRKALWCNQQKLIVAREFQRQPRMLIAAQPTRGVDVGPLSSSTTVSCAHGTTGQACCWYPLSWMRF